MYSYQHGAPYEGSWAYTYGDPCYDDHQDDQWETCKTTVQVVIAEVQDIRAYIYNSTVGRVQINDITFEDGTA